MHSCHGGHVMCVGQAVPAGPQTRCLPTLAGSVIFRVGAGQSGPTGYQESVGGSSIQTSSDHNATAQLSECVPAVSSQTDNLVGAGLQGGHFADGEVGRDSETSRVCRVASGRQAPQHQSPKDGRKLRRQDPLETIEKEELALVLTDRQLKVSPRNEAQELIRKNKQPLRIMSIPAYKPGGPCEIYYLRDDPSGPILSSAPLFVLFKEPLEVKEAYRCLEALLDEEGEAETVGSQSVSSGGRIRLSRKQLATLRRATRQGAETRCRMLSLCPDTETQAGGTYKNIERTSDRLAAPVESQPKATLLHGSQAEDIRSSTYRRLDSLEETIRQLETTLQEIGAHPACSFLEQGTDEIATVAFETSHSPDKKKPPIPPKPTGVPAVITKGGGSGKGLHSSASSRLKHLQQSAPEKGKTSKLREDFLKSQGQQQQ